jgi:hypothetical protein
VVTYGLRVLRQVVRRLLNCFRNWIW